MSRKRGNRDLSPDWVCEDRCRAGPATDAPGVRWRDRETARDFGQKCLYFERAGEAEFIWAAT